MPWRYKSIEIAFFVFLISILISKTAKPEKIAVVGNWISVAGAILQAISETDLYFKDKKRERLKEINEIYNEINELEQRLKELKQ